MLTSGLMDRAHAPTITVIALVPDAVCGPMDRAHAPTITVIAMVPDVDKWSDG